MQAKTKNNESENKIGISILRDTESRSYINTAYLPTSSIDAETNGYDKIYRQDYAITTQPFEVNPKNSIADFGDLNKRKNDLSSIVIDSNSQTHPNYNKIIVKKTTKTSNSSTFCSFCRFFVNLVSLFIQCIHCLSSCFCSPCLFATALVGYAGVLGFGALFFNGTIVLPSEWTRNICNTSENNNSIYRDQHRNISILYPTTTTQVPGITIFILLDHFNYILFLNL